MPAAVFLTLFLAACAASNPAPSSRSPQDFALGLTIVGDASDSGSPDHAPWRSSAWYLVEADAQLRAAEGDRLPTSLTPPILRQLAPEEMDQLWQAAAEGGLAQRLGSESGASDAPRAGDGPGTAIVYVRANGRRSAHRVDLRSQGAHADATRKLATLLAAWSGVVREPAQR